MDVGGHLKMTGFALITGNAVHYICIGNGFGLNGVEFDGCRGGMKVLCSRVKTLEYLFQVVGAHRKREPK